MSTSPKVLLVYAEAAMRLNKLDVARAVYLRLIHWMESNGWKDGDQREAHEGLAEVSVRLKSYEDAVKNFEWLIERWSEKRWYRYRLGVAYGLAARFDKSIEALQPLQDEEPSALICSKIGFANFQKGNIELACQYFNEALMLDDDTKQTFLTLADDVRRLYKAILPDPQATSHQPLADIAGVLAQQIRATLAPADISAIMADVEPHQRGVISGMLNLSRNLGLVTGASVMGAVFAFASRTSDITTAPPAAIATGMQVTFAVAAGLIVVALAVSIAGRALEARPSRSGDRP